jgi:adenylate cyclase
MLVNFRPEYDVPWSGKSYYRQLPLLPLGPDAMRELLEHLMGSDPSLGDLAETIQQRAAGNPFFIEEMVQSLIEAGSLEGERGDYKLLTPVHEIALPERVETLLAARIDRIDEREKIVLQTASVIGKEFSRAVLGKVCDLDVSDIDEALRALTAAEFVHERQIYPAIEYAFKHPLTQDVAYRSLLGERRRTNHAAVARAIEEHSGEGGEDVAALLAHHYEEAGEALAAARWHRVAAERLGFVHARDAYRHWSRVLVLSDEYPDETAAVQLGTVARIRMFESGARLNLPEEEMENLFRESKAIVESRGDEEERVQLLISYGYYRLYVTGNAREALGPLSQATDLADRFGNLEQRLSGRYAACLVHYNIDLNRAAEISEEAFELMRDQPEARSLRLSSGVPAEVNFLVMRAQVLRWTGRLTEARGALGQLRTLVHEVEEAEPLSQWLAGTIAIQAGDLVAAERECVHLIESSEAAGSISTLAMGLGILGQCLVSQGRAAEAIAPLERAIAIHREQRIFRQSEPGPRSSLAEAQLQLGDLDRADEIARETLAFTRERGLLAQEIRTHRCLARIALARKDSTSAREAELALERAEEIIDQVGCTAERPNNCELRAELAAASGDTTERDRQLRLARDLYEEIGATGHLERLRAVN